LVKSLTLALFSEASTMPRTARIGPTLVIGLLGAITTTPASAMLSRTPGAGDADSAPSNRTAHGALVATPYKEFLNPISPSSMVTMVRRRSPVAGSTRDAMPNRRQISV
jgi:hypothetical protein